MPYYGICELIVILVIVLVPLAFVPALILYIKHYAEQFKRWWKSDSDTEH